MVNLASILVEKSLQTILVLVLPHVSLLVFPGFFSPKCVNLATGVAVRRRLWTAAFKICGRSF